MSSVSWVRMVDSRVVWALSCESRSDVWEESSANDTVLACFSGLDDTDESESEGSVSLRYSAGSNWGCRKGASVGSAT